MIEEREDAIEDAPIQSILLLRRSRSSSVENSAVLVNISATAFAVFLEALTQHSFNTLKCEDTFRCKSDVTIFAAASSPISGLCETLNTERCTHRSNAFARPFALTVPVFEREVGQYLSVHLSVAARAIFL